MMNQSVAYEKQNAAGGFGALFAKTLTASPTAHLRKMA
jgi:hypothetical protein